jgi:plastocyanin
MKQIIIVGLSIVFVGAGSLWWSTEDVKFLNDLSPNIDLVQNENEQYVLVRDVLLEAPGYVAIREYVNDKVGQVIEVSDYLEAGTHQQVRIDIPFVSPHEMDMGEDGNTGLDLSNPIVVIYLDSGDRGFNPTFSKIGQVNKEHVASRFILSGEYVPKTKVATISGLSTPHKHGDKEVIEIFYTDEGFIPQDIKIEQGVTVDFINQSSKAMWVASDDHPGHSILSTFDQFGTAGAGGTYEYTFDKVGVWGYHDHVEADKIGTITVR